MRETTVSIDDITVNAAKAKLAALAERPGYAEALVPPARGARTAQYILLALTAGFGALTYACYVAMAPGLLRVVLLVALVLLTLFLLMATLGSAPLAVPALWGAAVIAESHEQRDGDSKPEHRIVLLDDKGAQHELQTTAELANALRIGDVGIAHVRGTMLVSFARL